MPTAQCTQVALRWGSALLSLSRREGGKGKEGRVKCRSLTQGRRAGRRLWGAPHPSSLRSEILEHTDVCIGGKELGW